MEAIGQHSAMERESLRGPRFRILSRYGSADARVRAYDRRLEEVNARDRAAHNRAVEVRRWLHSAGYDIA